LSFGKIVFVFLTQENKKVLAFFNTRELKCIIDLKSLRDNLGVETYFLVE